MTDNNLETRISALEAQVQEIRDLLQQTAWQQAAAQTQLDRLEAAQSRTEQNLNRLDQKFENFLAEWSRIHAHDAERLIRMEAGIDANRAAIERLTRHAEADRLENRINRDRVNVLIERVEELIGR